MTDPKPTIYEADPHTQAKHRILRAYLDRWLPILDSQSQRMGTQKQRLLYVDGFAGAGVYEDSVPGSPLVPIEAAIQHHHKFSCPIEIRLIEKRRDRVEHLRKLINERRAHLGSSTNLVIPDPIEGDCETEVRKLIDECRQKNQKLGPAFFFLDQFGYSSFQMDLIGTILKHEVCEVFSYLNWNLLHPFMSDPNKHAGITKAFGGDEWRPVIDLHDREKEDLFRSVYMGALKKRGNTQFVYPFAMRDSSHRVIYWLFFCTNNIRGLEEMKEAMWSVDRAGGFEFSDQFVSTQSSLYAYSNEELASAFVKQFNGEQPTIRSMKLFALENTPAYKYMEALQLMERDGRLKPISPPPKRRKGAFADYLDMAVHIRQLQVDGKLFD